MVGAAMVAKDEDSKRYRLTLKFFHWGSKAAARFIPPPSINQEMLALAEEINGAVFYFTRDGLLVLGLERTDWKDGQAVTIPYAGNLYHWSDSPFGRTLVAFSPPLEIERLLELEAYRGTSKAEMSALEADLQGIRERGFAERERQSSLHLYLAMAPILDSSGYSAGLLIAMEPKDEVPENRPSLIAALLNSASRCSASLGHRPLVTTL